MTEPVKWLTAADLIPSNVVVPELGYRHHSCDECDDTGRSVWEGYSGGVCVLTFCQDCIVNEEFRIACDTPFCPGTKNQALVQRLPKQHYRLSSSLTREKDFCELCLKYPFRRALDWYNYKDVATVLLCMNRSTVYLPLDIQKNILRFMQDDEGDAMYRITYWDVEWDE